MSTAIQAASGIDDLLRIDDPALPYRFADIFEAPSWLAKRRAKHRLRLLKELDTELTAMLEPGEQVCFISWGQEYSFVESYFMGLWAQLMNRRAIVLTEQRILILQISSRRKLLQLKAQVRYEAIRKIARGHLRLCLRKGGKLTLTGIPRADRKKARAWLEARMQADSPENAGLGKEMLCPHCYKAVEKFPAACPNCRGAFKTANRAGLLSLGFPGLGDWYLGYRGLALVEMLGAAAMWGFLALGFTGAQANGETVSIASMLIVAAVAIGFGHGLDALVTRHTGKKGLYPAASD